MFQKLLIGTQRRWDSDPRAGRGVTVLIPLRLRSQHHLQTEQWMNRKRESEMLITALTIVPRFQVLFYFQCFSALRGPDKPQQGSARAGCFLATGSKQVRGLLGLRPAQPLPPTRLPGGMFGCTSAGLSITLFLKTSIPGGSTEAPEHPSDITVIA